MSTFLNEFSDLLSSVDRDASVSRTWGKLLPLVCSQNSNIDFGGLWLVDREKTKCTATLWHWWARETQNEAKPEYISFEVDSVDADSYSTKFDKNIEFGLRELRKQGFVDDDHVVENFPIQVHLDSIRRDKTKSRRKETIGAISLFRTKGETAFSDEVKTELEMGCRLVGSWMRLNREWRKSTAVSAFQRMQTIEQSERALASSAVEQLSTFASAHLASGVYVHDSGTLTRIGYQGKLTNPLPVETGSLAYRFHFELPSGLGSIVEHDLVQLLFDAEGSLQNEDSSNNISLSDFPEVDAQGKPVSLVLARVRDSNGSPGKKSDVKPPVIATFMMATCATQEFIGGRFSQTNQAVLQLIMDAFRDSYSLAMQRARMTELTQKFDKIAQLRSGIDINDDAADIMDFSPFAKMARDQLPTVMDAVIELSSVRNDFRSFWSPSGPLKDLPIWAQNQSEKVPTLSEAIDPAIWGFKCETKPNHSDLSDAISFHTLQSSRNLPHIERSLLDRIIAEARLEQHLHINRDDWAEQLAHVRHNMRAVLGSIIGKTQLLSKRYEAVARTKDSSKIVDRLVTQGHFRKNLRRLAHSGRELEAIFENIRALVGKLEPGALQIARFDLTARVRYVAEILELEAAARKLKFNVVDLTRPQTRFILSDRVWTDIVLFNLLENAVKYSDRDGVIDIVIESDGPFWVLHVDNEGRFIPPEKRQAIFKPFERVKHGAGLQAMPGTGLGLMTVKQYVALHERSDTTLPRSKSSIEVYSEPLKRDMKGKVLSAATRFTIRLPRKGPNLNE